MKQIQDILSLISDPTINDNEWGDVMVLHAIKMAEEVYASGNEKQLIEAIQTLHGTSQIRLIDVILSFEVNKYFDDFIKMASMLEIEAAELIFDSLRTWNLSTGQSTTLLETYLPFKGQSKLLDYVMADFRKRQSIG
jgi:hypothetical protein